MPVYRKGKKRRTVREALGAPRNMGPINTEFFSDDDTERRSKLLPAGNVMSVGPMSLKKYRLLCLHNILDGLKRGLTKFSGPSRIALVYAIDPDEPLRILDPQDLLFGHQPAIKKYFASTDEWRLNLPEMGQVFFDHTLSQRLDLDGLISLGGRSRGCAYQMWFTERHPDLCSAGPTSRWLEFALLQLSQSLVVQDVLSLDAASYLLCEMALHAVHDYISDKRLRIIDAGSDLNVYNLLDVIIQISKTPEEGAWARGALAFVERANMPDVHFLSRFPKSECPKLDNYKHVRKLLQAVECGDRTLISDGESIAGIAVGELPPGSLCTEFNGRRGILKLDGKAACSFSDGTFHSTNYQPSLGALQDALLKCRFDPAHLRKLFMCINRIVAVASEENYGCGVIIDSNKRPLHLSGQTLDAPIDLNIDKNLDLAIALARVDGVLHIDADLKLHAFACLMDGPSLPREDRSRGARYNSALRFTAKHPELIVVVVSSDRPVSIIQGGINLSKTHAWPAIPKTLRVPPTLKQWLEE
jgi:hypothetical protein